MLNISNQDPDSVANPISIDKDRGDVFFAIPDLSEPPKFDETKTKSLSPLPSVGGYTQLRGLTLGFGFYLPVGTEIKWDDTINDALAEIKAKYNTLIGLSVTNLCLAKQINEKLSLGLGINYLSFTNEKEATKNYTSNYNYSLKANSSGDGLEGILGVLCKVGEKLKVGLVYRSGSKIEIDGDAKVDHSIPIAGARVNGESKFKGNFYHPATYGLGLSYQYLPRLLLACDIARTDWSTTKKDITYTSPKGSLTNESAKSLDWKATNRYRFGARYQKDKNLSLSGGFYIDEAPSPDKAQGITGIVDPPLKVISIGTSYKKGSLNYDALLGYGYASRKAAGLKYEKTAFSTMITVSYLF